MPPASNFSPSSRRTEKEDSSDVFTSQLIDEFWREDSGGEGAPEDGVEFSVETADSHLVEVPVRIDDGLEKGKII